MIHRVDIVKINGSERTFVAGSTGLHNSATSLFDKPDISAMIATECKSTQQYQTIEQMKIENESFY